MPLSPRLWSAAVCLTVLLVGPRLGAAQPVEFEQPEIVPRSIVVLRPIRAYADPAVPATQTGLRDLSLRDLHTQIERFFDRDPRYDLVRGDVRALALARDEAQQDLTFIAEQSARLGGEHYRSYNLATAAGELRAAAETYARTTRPLTHPSEVGEVYLTLALVELERARAHPDERAVHESHADQAFRSLARIDPGRVVDPNLYPPSVVEAWQRAYVAHFVSGGASLELRVSEAAHLARLLEVDALVHAFTTTDRDGTFLHVQVYDAVENRFELHERLPIDGSQADAEDGLMRRLSTTVACQTPIAPPAPAEPDPERGSLYLTLSYASATYLTRPTDRLFYNRGARLSASWMMLDTFGFYLSGAQWVASRDPDGELLASVDTTRGALGILAGGRVGRLRAFGQAGFDIARVGRVRATDDFWCKVSEGEPVEFDDERACLSSDVIDTDAQAQWGFTFGVGADLQIVGPAFLHASVGSSVTVTPFEGRAVSTPVWVDIGATYRF